MATNLPHNNESPITNSQNIISKGNKFLPGLVQTSAPKIKSDLLIGCVILIAITLLFALLAFKVTQKLEFSILVNKRPARKFIDKTKELLANSNWKGLSSK